MDVPKLQFDFYFEGYKTNWKVSVFSCNHSSFQIVIVYITDQQEILFVKYLNRSSDI
jgi:hypothetical protein